MTELAKASSGPPTDRLLFLHLTDGIDRILIYTLPRSIMDFSPMKDCHSFASSSKL